MKDWVRIPTKWLTDKSAPLLKDLSWRGEHQSDNIAALMLYVAINQQTPEQETKTRLTYDNLCLITSLSRAKVSAGIKIIENLGLIKIEKKGRSNIYHIIDRDQKGGWAKLPARTLYDNDGQIEPFNNFKLRSRTELDALKLYLLIIAFRDNKKNHTTIAYEKISQYTGISERHVRSAISFLVTLNMIHVDKHLVGDTTEKRMNVYRVIGINNRQHAGNMPKDAFATLQN